MTKEEQIRFRENLHKSLDVVLDGMFQEAEGRRLPLSLDVIAAALPDPEPPKETETVNPICSICGLSASAHRVLIAGYSNMNTHILCDGERVTL